MLDDFMIRAALAGIGVSLAAAPIGCFVVWRRMAYFGEATAHAALLGVALSLAFEISVFTGAILVSLIMASLVTLTEGRSLFLDTLLGVAGHSSIAAGLVIVSFISGVRIDLMAYLIGDILAVSHIDLLFIWVGVGVILSLIIWRWSQLLLVTLNEDLASANGINPKRENFIITISLAIIVVASLNLVIDFDFIEEGAEKGAPKYMEWYGAFGLLVTLIWLYLEILRMLAKLRSR
mgnify:CR=1 FL=1